jgi:putative FmdB family regulatory protein
MPIYSYRCDKCGETFDKLVKPGGNGSIPCVHCESDTRRVYSPVGIIFKGSGFYSTDYKSGSKNASGNTSEAKDKAEKTKDQKPKAEKGSKDKKSGSTDPGK